MDSDGFLAARHGGRVLDAATGSGAFAFRLAVGLDSYEELVGIDTSPKAAEAFGRNAAGFEAARLRGPRPRFEARDAAASGWEAGRFDTVAVANSLHHFPDPGAALAELARLLAPGGLLLVQEMHRDAEEPARRSHVELHHWWAAVDSASGIYHAETYGREALLEALRATGLEEELVLDEAEEGEPREAETFAEIERVVAAYRGRAGALQGPEAARLEARGAELLELVRREGFLPAPSVFAAFRKPA